MASWVCMRAGRDRAGRDCGGGTPDEAGIELKGWYEGTWGNKKTNSGYLGKMNKRGRPRLEGGEEERRKRARERVREWKAGHGWSVAQQKARAYARHKKKSTPCGVMVELKFDE